MKAEAATVAVKKAVDTSVRIPEDGQIYISEIMFAGGGTLPQWIEIANGSKSEEVNLSGWTLTVENATADADVSVGASAKFTIPEGTRIDRVDSTIHHQPFSLSPNRDVATLPVRWQTVKWSTSGRTSSFELFRLDIFKRRYSLLSDMAFKITLAPPAATHNNPSSRCNGCCGEPRCGMAQRHGHCQWLRVMLAVLSSVGMSQALSGPAEPKDGEKMESWVLASDTSFSQSVLHLSAHSYYGLPIDIGTPGFRAGGALPVELSHFRPERRKDTGAVVITWSTQSELHNAGFFIKRSRQRDGEFKVVNATMILGAGTTSEKQFYTYTDTTAQPNVVYYYQIEDVSLDGNHQTLTRGIRLRGYVGAAGKVTTLWGELKRTN